MADEPEEPQKPEPPQSPSKAVAGRVRVGRPIQRVGGIRRDDIGAREAAHRFRIQTWIGLFVAVVVSLTVLALLVLVIVLALQGRSVEYIKGVVESLQPYVLPAFGVLVGYALGRKPDE